MKRFLLTQGYGVMDNPTMPVVAKDGREPNDTYVEPLVSSRSCRARGRRWTNAWR